MDPALIDTDSERSDRGAASRRRRRPRWAKGWSSVAVAGRHMVLLSLRRALTGVVVLWGALSLMFVLFFVVPGDRVAQIIGGDRVVTAEHRAATVERLDLDEPAYVQYASYWERLAHGELGTSFVNGQDVSSIVAQTVPASLRLAFWAVSIQVLIGMSTGIVSAIARWRWLRALASSWTAIVLALPVFAIGYVLQLIFGVFAFEHGWPDWARLPVQGSGPNTWWLGVIPTGEQWRYVLLPAFTLAAISSALTSRLMRASLRRTMEHDYIRGARAKGLHPRQVARHGIRNSLPPVIAFVGLDLVNLFGSAVVTEYVFNWPGVGSEIAEALGRQDAPVILGLSIVLGVAYLVANLAVDVIHALLDPRVRAS